MVMKRLSYSWCLPALLAAIVVLILSADAGVPALVDFQGSLTDESGHAVSGQLSVRFALYDAEAGGSMLWEETQTVTVEDGIYNVKLGSVTAFPGDIWETAQLWLGVKAGSAEEMTPRARLVAVPYALRARTAEALAPGAAHGMILARKIGVSESPAYTSFFRDRYGSSTTPDDASLQAPLPRNGILKNLLLKPWSTPDEGASATVIILVNGQETALGVTHTHADGLAAASNTSTSVAVQQGDVVTLKRFSIGTLDNYWVTMEIQ